MARPRKFVEDEVLLSARAQFWHHGYEGTSMSDLCEATGVASQSLYGAFGSKHGLFVRTLDDYCEHQVAGLEEGSHAATSPWKWLLDAVAFGDSDRLPLTSDGCFLSSSTAARARIDPEVQAASRRTYDRIVDLFAETVAAAQQAGEVRDGLEPRRVAFALLAAMQGLEFIRKSGVGDEFETAKSSVLEGLDRAYGKNEALA